MDISLSMPNIPISGTVILYNPDRYVLGNIASYIDYIDASNRGRCYIMKIMSDIRL
jgi:hypothetical protein